MRISKSCRPILKGFVLGGQIHVWCPYCARYHFHGWPDEQSNRPESRVAHCTGESSPFMEGGYYIVPYTKSELSKFRLAKRS